MADRVADLTLVHLPRIEQKQDRMLDVLERHDVRLGRLERDVHEIEGDLITIENQLLSRMNEILNVVERVDDHESRLRTLENSAELT